jgi:L-lactate dehydrogenase complex protein LldE
VKVTLFATCLGDELYPDVARSAARVLERLGCEVHVPKRPLCCGQPAFNSGYFSEAKRVADAWVEAFSGADFVVSPSGSCAGMVHHNYERLFEREPARLAEVKELAARTYEFSQFLVEVLRVEKLEASFPHSVTYHASCHAERLLGLGKAPLSLLGAIPDLTLAPLPRVEDCCGFGGSFAVKLSGISTAIVDEKVDHIESTGAHYVTSTDLGCLMNIAGRMDRRGVPVTALHLASLLDRALAEKEARA